MTITNTRWTEIDQYSADATHRVRVERNAVNLLNPSWISCTSRPTTIKSIVELGWLTPRKYRIVHSSALSIGSVDPFHLITDGIKNSNRLTSVSYLVSLIVIVLFTSGSATAQPNDLASVNSTELNQAWQPRVEHEILREWRERSGTDPKSHSLHWPVSAFDTGNQPCHQGLEWQPHQQIKPGRNQVRIRCRQPFWQINSSFKLRQMQLVAVLKEDHYAGDSLTPSHIDFINTDISELQRGYLTPKSNLDDWQFKRFIRRGSVIDLDMLTPMMIVERGQQVTIRAQRPGFTIDMKGIALSDGARGDRVRVKNQQTERIIWANVQDSQLVLVTH